MINSYNSVSQNVAVGGLVSFDTDKIKTGCTVVHSEGTATFKLAKPGYYYISFNANVAASDTAGDVTIQLRKGLELVPGAVGTTSSTAATDISNIAFVTIVQVPPSCCVCDNTVTLSLVNNGVAAVITDANINITKLC